MEVPDAAEKDRKETATSPRKVKVVDSTVRLESSSLAQAFSPSFSPSTKISILAVQHRSTKLRGLGTLNQQRTHKENLILGTLGKRGGKQRGERPLAFLHAAFKNATSLWLLAPDFNLS